MKNIQPIKSIQTFINIQPQKIIQGFQAITIKDIFQSDSFRTDIYFSDTKKLTYYFLPKKVILGQPRFHFINP